MSNDLIISKISSALSVTKPEYTSMLKNIEERMPIIEHDSSNFHKGHSQFMQSVLDVTPLTPMRSIHQSLAEAEQTRMALQEAYFGIRKKQVEIKRKQAQLETVTDQFDKELLEIEIAELSTSIENTQNYVNGAIRKLNYFANQHKQLLEKIGKEKITEEDYELEETKYHIMTAMKQALNSARPRNGIIDEGNSIYLFDLGINVAQAQAEVFAYLNVEQQLLAQGQSPSHEMTVKWLEACAEKWKDAPINFAKWRGFSTLDKDSLTNLLPNNSEQ